LNEKFWAAHKNIDCYQLMCVVLQVPYELLNKKFRAAHKNVDREVARVQCAANELEKCLQKPATIADLTLALDSVAEKLTILKRKVFLLLLLLVPLLLVQLLLLQGAYRL